MMWSALTPQWMCAQIFHYLKCVTASKWLNYSCDPTCSCTAQPVIVRCKCLLAKDVKLQLPTGNINAFLSNPKHPWLVDVGLQAFFWEMLISKRHFLLFGIMEGAGSCLSGWWPGERRDGSSPPLFIHTHIWMTLPRVQGNSWQNH